MPNLKHYKDDEGRLVDIFEIDGVKYGKISEDGGKTWSKPEKVKKAINLPPDQQEEFTRLVIKADKIANKKAGIKEKDMR